MTALSADVVTTLTPSLVTIPTWTSISGMGRTSTYVAMGQGKLKAVKLGRRTLIDVQAGLAWLRSLPAAQFTTGKCKLAA